MFIYKTKKFILNNGSECKLVLPDLKYAEEIYKIIEIERLRLAKYLPWVMDMKSVQDEEQFLEYSIDKIHKEEMMMFIILVDENVAGMIDLHNINRSSKRAEVGYWLSEKFEGYGIMTQAVDIIEKYSFKELKLDFLDEIISKINLIKIIKTVYLFLILLYTINFLMILQRIYLISNYEKKDKNNI